MSPVSPLTKAARQAQVAAVLGRVRVRSQDELASLLAQRGVKVTQATLSRDLEELGAVRLRGPGGALVYALPGEPGGPGSWPGGMAAPAGGGRGAASRQVTPAPPPPATGAQLPAAVPGSGRAGGARGGERGRGTPENVPGTLPRLAADLLVSAEASANLVVLRTPAGGAQLLAGAIDHAEWPTVLGTVAGDDTVLVITREPMGGESVARALLRLAERRAT